MIARKMYRHIVRGNCGIGNWELGIGNWELLISIPVTLLMTSEETGVHFYFARAKHFGRQFISENQRFYAEMLRPYEDICQNEMHPFLLI
jgi:hypothetical protein